MFGKSECHISLEVEHHLDANGLITKKEFINT